MESCTATTATETLLTLISRRVFKSDDGRSGPGQRPPADRSITGTASGQTDRAPIDACGTVPIVVDVALSSAQPGLPDHFFFLPAGRQSGTVRPLPLHHRRLLVPPRWLQTDRSTCVKAPPRTLLTQRARRASGAAGGGSSSSQEPGRTDLRHRRYVNGSSPPPVPPSLPPCLHPSVYRGYFGLSGDTKCPGPDTEPGRPALKWLHAWIWPI